MKVSRVVEFLHLAKEWRGQLERGEVATRVEIATREGLTDARVNQVLALLQLDAQVLEMVQALPPGTPERRVTARWLLGLRALSRRGQRAALSARWVRPTQRRVG